MKYRLDNIIAVKKNFLMISKRCSNKTWTTTTHIPSASLCLVIESPRIRFTRNFNKQAIKIRWAYTRSCGPGFSRKKLLFPRFFFYLWCFIPYRLYSHCINNFNFLKTLACFVTIHERHHSSFVYYRNFVVFSKSNVT